MSNIILADGQQAITPAPVVREAFELMAYGLTENSKRQYQHTFNLWRGYCADTRTAPHELSAGNIIGFLNSVDLARKTKMARLTHLRKLAQTLHTGDIANPMFKQNYEQLRLLKLPKDDTGGKKRQRKALNPDEVIDALRFWPQNTNLGIRNRALLAVLFYAGLRRSEAAAMKWEHIDFEAGLLTLPHRKNHDDDKTDVIPFASGKALDVLKRWRACIPDYEYVFVAIQKGDKIQSDTPISTETIRRVCRASGDFKPHDARRTLLTNLLTMGTPLPDAQFIAGHAQGATTMHYAIVKDATEVKGRVKLNY